MHATRSLMLPPGLAPRAAVGLIGCALGLAMGVSACRGASAPAGVAGTVTLVNRVQTAVRGITCTSCPATVKAALRERMEPATITVDPGRSVELVFESGSSVFSSASFRSALAAGGGEASSISIEACGSIQVVNGEAWLTSGATRLLLEGASPPASSTEACVTGELRDLAVPPRLVLGRFGA